MTERQRIAPIDLAVTVLLLGVAWAYLLSYFRPSLLWLDTMISGGDTPSFLRPVHHLRETLLPAGNPQGWDLGNFGGYAPYQFYFLPPSLIIIALALVIPFNIAFKLITVAGTFLLPLMTTWSLRAMGYGGALTALGAVASLVFLFNEGNSMWGGNIPSTLAGEFAHSLGFAFAVLFIGLLYRGITEQRGWRSRAVILAFAGLCHPVAFANAATPGLFFLLDRRRLGANVRYLFQVYGGALLLMAFWLVPLGAKLGYATSINWTWHFGSWREVLPRMLYPVAALAVLDVVWIAVRPRPTDRPARYLLLAVIATAVSFFNATEVGLPEIRFVPFIYFLCILLALDVVGRLMALTRVPWLAALAFAAGMLVWVGNNTSFIPHWIRWNYEGLQRKPSYPLLRSIMDAVHGTISDPRVAYENSPAHERFGSMRIFEDLPLLAGRGTHEGVLLQTAVTSPFIYWLQSEISKQGTGVIPGYSYPAMDLAHAVPRFHLFNISDMIAVTPEVISALDQDARWKRLFANPPYAVFRLKEGDWHYVRVPRFRPAMVETTRWKKDFHRWFATDAALDVPVVMASQVPAAERSRFTTARVAWEPPHEPLDTSGCRIDEHIDHLTIDFDTTCPGLPHLIAVAYYPNWRVEGASRVYLVSPAFMLVFPDGPHVRLAFRRIAVDWLGILLTLAGVAACLVPARRRAPGAVETPRALAAAQPWVLGGLVLVALGSTGWNLMRDVAPAHYYQLGWRAFEKQDYKTSREYFERAIFFGGETTTAADATFFRAASLLRAGQPGPAMAGYQTVIDRFPDSIWVAESHYHVGLCLRQLFRPRRAKEKFRYVIDNYPGNRWAGFSTEQLKDMRNQARQRAQARRG